MQSEESREYAAMRRDQDAAEAFLSDDHRYKRRYVVYGTQHGDREPQKGDD